MDAVSFLLVAVILTALAFDFTNGFHDTANSMATSIATGALSPRVAVAVAGVLNLAGAFLSTEPEPSSPRKWPRRSRVASSRTARSPW